MVEKTDRVVAIAFVVGLVLSLAVSGLALHGLFDLIDMLPKPRPAEIPWAQRIEFEDTSFPLQVEEEDAGMVEETKPVVLPGPAHPHAWRPPCRSCGPSRHSYLDEERTWTVPWSEYPNQGY